MLLQHSGERHLANALARTRRRQAPPQVECPLRRDVVVHRVEELRIVAPELLPHPIRQANAFPRQVLVETRPLPQLDDRRVGRFQPSQTVRVGTQRRGEHPRVAPVVLRARRRHAVPEAVELLRVDRVDGEAPLHQALDHRSARRLDRHADFALVARRERQQPVRHLRQSCTAVLELPLPEHVPGGVKHARLMFLRPPVDTRKPCQLQPGAGDRPAGFGERGEETYPWESACGPGRKRPEEPPTPYRPRASPRLYTNLVGTLHCSKNSSSGGSTTPASRSSRVMILSASQNR